MKSNPLEQPAPALALAIGATMLSHKATRNAARALGVPVAVLSVLVASVLAMGALRSG
jgi:hypothetical protein